MWGNTLIIDRLPASCTPSDLQTKQEDKLILNWEERRWTRGRFTTAQGRKIGIALPTGTILAPGAILHVASDWYLKLEAAVEPVLEIRPADSEEAIRIAYEIGNRHFPMALEAGRILVPDDKAMVRLMERLGVPCERRQTIFDPLGNTPLHQHESISRDDFPIASRSFNGTIS